MIFEVATNKNIRGRIAPNGIKLMKKKNPKTCNEIVVGIHFSACNLNKTFILCKCKYK